MMRRATVLGPLLLVAFAACGERRATGPVPQASTMDGRTDVALAPASASPSASAAAPAREAPRYPALVREERWAEAEAELAALPEAEREKPALKYLRARVALARGAGKDAFPLLDKLEEKLPLLEADIKRWRGEAALAAGAWAAAAKHYEGSAKARDLVHAAEAQEKLGDKAAALKLAERAMLAADKTKSARDQIAARVAHARVAAAIGGEAAALPDRRWLAMHATGAERRAAEKALDEAKKPLTRAERLSGAEALVERGAAADALELLDGITDKNPDVKAARALALVKARRWKDALEAVRAALRVKTGREAELAYQEARVLGRLGKHDDAVKVYADVARRHRKTPFGDRASYGVARTHLQRGKFAEAQKGFTAYLAEYPKGEKNDDAELDLALASLSAGDPKTARRTFEKLAKAKKNDEAALMRELAAVSALKAKEKDAAIAAFKDVAKGWPLSFAAQASRGRLASLGAAPPAWIEPAPAGAAAAPLEVALPPVVELLSSLGLDGDAEAALAGMEQSAAAVHAGRESEALCAMYGKLSRAKRRYKVASAAVSYTTLLRAPAPAERWQWECLYPRPYLETVKGLEEKNKLPKNLGFAIMRQESVFDPTISSPAGAVGLLQLLPSTASAIAKETGYELGQKPLTSPEVNLTLGTAYLGKLLKTFQGSLPLAIAAYNAGPGAVSQWLDAESDNEVDLWVARIPYEETRTYVQRVLGNLARYRYVEGGEAALEELPLAVPTKHKAGEDDY